MDFINTHRSKAHLLNVVLDGLLKPTGQKELDSSIHYGAPRRLLKEHEHALFRSWANTRYEITVPSETGGKSVFQPSGAELFTRIVESPEYYINPSEISLFKDCSQEIGQELAEVDCLIELGPGSGEKSCMVLDICKDRKISYVAIEMSSSFVEKTSGLINNKFPAMHVEIVNGDFTDTEVLTKLSTFDVVAKAKRPCLMALGATLGNFELEKATEILGNISATLNLRERGLLMLSLDCNHEQRVLQRAYGDLERTGVFCLNALATINHELGSYIRLENFDYRAIWNSNQAAMEMRLISKLHQKLNIGYHVINLRADEPILMGRSRKWNPAQINSLLNNVEFNSAPRIYDRNGLNLLFARGRTPHCTL